MQYGLVATALAGALYLTGCSTASYQNQVSDFSADLTEIRTTVEAVARDERQALVQTETQKALAAGDLIEIPSECGITPTASPAGDLSKIDCRPRFRNAKTGETRAITFNPAVPNALKLVASLDAYGKGLLSLASAKDVADLKDATAETAAAISRLASTVDSNAGAPLGPVTSFVSWAIGKYLDQRRFEELKNAVGRADPLVKAAADLLERQLPLLQQNIVNARATRLQREQTSVARMQKTAKGDRYQLQRSADRLIQDALALQEFAMTDAAAPFEKMKDTHQTLLNALDKPDTSLETIYQQLSEFADQVDRLQSGLAKSAGGN